MTTLTTSYQTIASGSYYSSRAGGTYYIYLQAKYSGQSGNSCTVDYRLLVNAPFYTTATSTSNSWVLNGTNAAGASASGGTFTLNGGDNVIKEISGGGVSGGSTVTVSGGYYMGYYTWGSTSLSGTATVPTFAVAPNTPTVSASIPPADPTGSVQITWGTTSFGTPSSGTVYLYGGTSSSPSTQLLTKTTTGNSVFTHNEPLTPNTKYYYRARACNSQLCSSYSSSVSAITNPIPPVITINSVTHSSCTFTISAPTQGNARVLDPYYSIDGGTFISTGSLPATITESFPPGTTHTISAYFSASSTITSTTATETFSTNIPFYGRPPFLSGTLEIKKLYGPIESTTSYGITGYTLIDNPSGMVTSIDASVLTPLIESIVPDSEIKDLTNMSVTAAQQGVLITNQRYTVKVRGTGIPEYTIVSDLTRSDLTSTAGITCSAIVFNKTSGATISTAPNMVTKLIEHLYGPVPKQILSSVTGGVQPGGAGNATSFDGATFYSAISQDASLTSSIIESGKEVSYMVLGYSNNGEYWALVLYFEDNTTVLVADSSTSTLSDFGVTSAYSEDGIDIITLTGEYETQYFSKLIF